MSRNVLKGLISALSVERLLRSSEERLNSGEIK